MGRKYRLLASVMLVAMMATASDAQTLRRQTVENETSSPIQTPANFQVASVLAQLQPARTNTANVTDIDWSAAAVDARRQSTPNLTNSAILTAPQSVIPSNDQATRITQTRLPVLLPAQALLDMGANPTVLLFPSENFYTASMTGNGLLVEVFGTRLIQAEAPDGRAAVRLNSVDSDGFRVQQTEYGREISFNRYGAAYSITLECDQPQTDMRCSDASYGRDLARSLLIVGGTPDEGG